MSPLYFAVMLSAPTGSAVVVNDAVAPARFPVPEKVAVPAVPVTATGLPNWVAPEKNVTVPFGAAPALSVDTVAFSVTDVPWLTVMPDDGDATVVVVVAEFIVTERLNPPAVELPERKLLSPEYAPLIVWVPGTRQLLGESEQSRNSAPPTEIALKSFMFTVARFVVVVPRVSVKVTLPVA